MINHLTALIYFFFGVCFLIWIIFHLDLVFIRHTLLFKSLGSVRFPLLNIKKKFRKDALNCDSNKHATKKGCNKSDSNDIYNVTKISISNECCSFELFVHQRILKNKCIMVSTNILSSTTVFDIDNNKKSFLSSNQISILEWFLKDHVTLNDAENSTLHHRNKLHFT